MKGVIPSIAIIMHTESFLVSAVKPALTIQSQNLYRGRVQDLTAQKHVGVGHRKHTHEPQLLLDQATRHCTNFLHIRCIAVELFSGNMFDCCQT